jgi:hypothetical protein
MSSNKSSLHEVASNAEALKTARSEPIQQAPAPRQTMDFIRSLVLDIPTQQYVEEKPVSESLNIERMLEAQLEAAAKKSSQDPTDSVAFDVPTLIRVFELVREGIKSDVELHDLVERLVAMRHKGVLSMADYDVIAGGNINGTTKEHEPQSIAADQQNESIAALKKLAGL